MKYNIFYKNKKIYRRSKLSEWCTIGDFGHQLISLSLIETIKDLDLFIKKHVMKHSEFKILPQEDI